MRNYYILLGLCLLLNSCQSKEPIDHGPGFCTIECNTPAIKLDLSNIAPEMTNAILKRFTADGSYSHIIDTIKQQPFYVSDAYDYEIITNKPMTITIGGIKIVPHTIDTYCGEECSDALINFRMLYDYKVVPVQWVLSEDQKEYVVYMR